MNNRKIIIAIDGHSSCGKSTFAKTIAARLGYIFIDTGAMYRAVTLYALEHGAIPSGIANEELVESLLGEINIDFRFNPARGASDIYVNGDLVESKIRTIEVDRADRLKPLYDLLLGDSTAETVDAVLPYVVISFVLRHFFINTLKSCVSNRAITTPKQSDMLCFNVLCFLAHFLLISHS